MQKLTIFRRKIDVFNTFVENILIMESWDHGYLFKLLQYLSGSNKLKYKQSIGVLEQNKKKIVTYSFYHIKFRFGESE